MLRRYGRAEITDGEYMEVRARTGASSGVSVNGYEEYQYPGTEIRGTLKDTSGDCRT